MSKNKAMTGSQLFDFYTSIEGEYKQTLMKAFVTVDEAELFDALEVAESIGKKVDVIENETEYELVIKMKS